VIEPKPNHPSNVKFFQIIQDMKDLSMKKQADYGSDQDPFANVREGAIAMGMSPWIGAAIRMNDKMRRINKAARLGPESLKNDSLLDDFIDMAVYAVIAQVLFIEEQENK
jgi:hypothetical protein